MLELLWSTFVTTFSLAVPRPAAAAMLALWFVLALGGIFIVSALVGLLTSGLNQRLEQLRKGRSRVIETGHTVILGWSDQVYTVVSELVEANRSRRRATDRDPRRAGQGRDGGPAAAPARDDRQHPRRLPHRQPARPHRPRDGQPQRRPVDHRAGAGGGHRRGRRRVRAQDAARDQPGPRVPRPAASRRRGGARQPQPGGGPARRRRRGRHRRRRHQRPAGRADRPAVPAVGRLPRPARLRRRRVLPGVRAAPGRADLRRDPAGVPQVLPGRDLPLQRHDQAEPADGHGDRPERQARGARRGRLGDQAVDRDRSLWTHRRWCTRCAARRRPSAR